jgi:MFS family permease
MRISGGRGLGDPAIRPVVLAQGVSVIGTQVTALALPTLAIVGLGASPVVASVLFAIEYGAQALLAPLLGVLVDRAASRRRLLVLANLVHGLVIAAVPAGYLLGRLNLPLLFGVAAATGVLGGLTAFGVQALVPSLVPAQRLVDANAALSGARSVGQVAGPALAGWLVQACGAALAMAVDAVSYGLSVVAFATLSGGTGTAAARDRPGLLRSLRDGVSALRGRPVLVRIAVTSASLNLGGSALGALYLVFAYRDLRLTPLLVGIAYLVSSLAAIAAVATAGRVVRRLGLSRVVPVFAPVAAASLLLVPAAAAGAPLATLIVYEAVFGYCATVWFIGTATLQQTLVPADQLGRVVALGRTLGALAIPVGAVLGGVLAGWWGMVPTLVCFAVVALLGAAATGSRRFPSGEPGAAAPPEPEPRPAPDAAGDGPASSRQLS